MPTRLRAPVPAPVIPDVALERDGWLGDLLRDPAAAVRDLLASLGEPEPRTWGVTVAALVAVTGVLGARGWCRRRRQRWWREEARTVTIVPPPQVDPAGGVALWSHLIGLLRPKWTRWWFGQPHLACEYVFTNTGVSIQVWVPGTIPPGLVERAVQSAWPGAHTRTHPAQPPLPEPEEDQRQLVAAGQLRLARPDGLPLRTEFTADPVRALLGAADGLRPTEHACVQILARPLASTPHAHSTTPAAAGITGVLRQVLDLITPNTTKPAPGDRAGRVRDPRVRLESAAADRASVAKQRGAGYETLVRYAVTTHLPTDTDKATVQQARGAVRGRAHALAATFASYTEHNHYTRRRLHHPIRALAERRLGRGDVLSVLELAALAHLPTDDAVPGLQRAGAKALAPPPGIAAPGPQVKPLGLTDAGQSRAVGLRVPDARHHLHVLGATGSGKSTLLASMILADVDARRGNVVIDPKGDLVTDILSRLPEAVADRVVLFDADSTARPPCLNPLDGEDTDRTVDNLVSVFRRVYSASWGPRTDDVMRAACLTLRAQHGVATLADLPKLLAEPAFRARVTAGLSDGVLRGFWAWYDELTDSSRSQVISPLMNKLRAFLLRPFVRDAIAAGPSTINLSTVLDGGLCLVRIPKGSLGEETTRLIGSLVVARTWQATTARARIPQRHRRDAALVIDECHNFLNLPYPIEDMLAEARGFRLSMTLAHQHLGQLPRELREGISTNARSKIFFNASPEDARDLARHTHPRLTDHDLAHLGAYHAAARLVAHGEQAEPFTLTTQPLPPAIPGRARHIRTTSRQQNSRPNTESTQDIIPICVRPTGPQNMQATPRLRETDPRRRTC
ncbi:type IV secretory system conjugative DNA transfer family protein [Saccharopolyspora hirsuta]|uniref:Type IV secretory system conjugative DNA transfer family protein n=1 Tax=Saccharopolyspora hirsuta TaxID=1837 RepID=A0A5M7BAZ5_SACHI|nr:DUF87 domain-containing protein [Saccharopolyspora hirsuta]KAA5825427.1 type IV secretory system conjugative DNA transfer family protein [Saccharopolyspora hirsuta]